MFLLVSACPVTAQDTYVVRDLAPGVFAAVAPEGVPPYLFANSLVAIGDSGVLVVDSGQRPALARELIALIRERTEQPVRWVINTHWHGDHVWGNEVFVDSFPGVQILATPATRDSISAASVRQIDEQIAQHREGRARLQAMLDTADADLRTRIRQADSVRVARIAELQAIRIVLPTRLFAMPLQLDLGGRTAVLLPLGPAHTPGDAAVWLPGERIVAVGDLLEEGELWLEGADVAGWLRALDALAALDARVLVPSHGGPSADGALFAAARAQLNRAAAPGTDAQAPDPERVAERMLAVNVPLADSIFARPSPVRTRPAPGTPAMGDAGAHVPMALRVRARDP